MIDRRQPASRRHSIRLHVERLEPRLTLSAHPLGALGSQDFLGSMSEPEPAVAVATAAAGVTETDSLGASHHVAQRTAFTETNLVSNLPDVAPTQDPNLVNSWGVARDASGEFWVADNGTGKITQYDANGTPSSLVIGVPSPGNSAPSGAVTGIVLSDEFVLKSNGQATRAIVATEDGTIAAWGPSLTNNTAEIVVDNSASGAVYKGLAMGRVGHRTLLYATDFHNNTIAVFDTHFNPVTDLRGAFTDPGKVPLPPPPSGAAPGSTYAPFGIRNIRGRLYVTYAFQDADKHDDVPGPGAGFVDVFKTNGQFVRRLATGGTLNSPWGLAVAPRGFGEFGGDVLVGNFGDSHVSVFDPYRPDGKNFRGQLSDANGQPLVLTGGIPSTSGDTVGLWGLEFGSGKSLFFAAGPNDESDGLFGKVTGRHPGTSRA